MVKAKVVMVIVMCVCVCVSMCMCVLCVCVCVCVCEREREGENLFGQKMKGPLGIEYLYLVYQIMKGREEPLFHFNIFSMYSKCQFQADFSNQSPISSPKQDIPKNVFINLC